MNSGRAGAAGVLSNVNLLVRDVGRARRFYAGAFGLVTDERRSAPPTMLIVGAGGCTLSLKDLATEDPAKRAGPGDIELGFETDDLDAVWAAVLAWGGEADPIVQLGFGRTFDARDPDGHHLSVYSLSPENR